MCASLPVCARCWLIYLMCFFLLLQGAVASIAFGECEPLVDGNVIRVLSRLKAVASDPKNAGLNKLCW